MMYTKKRTHVYTKWQASHGERQEAERLFASNVAQWFVHWPLSLLSFDRILQFLRTFSTNLSRRSNDAVAVERFVFFTCVVLANDDPMTM